MADRSGWLEFADAGDGPSLKAGGVWNAANAGRLDEALIQTLGPAGSMGRSLSVDMTGVTAIDTIGAWLLHRTMAAWREAGGSVSLHGAKPPHQALLDQVAQSYQPCEIVPPAGNSLIRVIAHIGEATIWCLRETGDIVAFFGAAIVAFLRVLVQPRRLRLTSTVHHMEQVGLNALPIVGLISFLVGVVLAYQGAQQLARFGADIFVVNMIAVSILREIGILLTAIVVAGRSGSAFTAQIGSMKVHEEVDAMRTLGLDPMEILVVPRVLALVLTLPLLTFFADIMGLLGGGLMAWAVLDIGPGLFLERLNGAADLNALLAGLIKAPVFAVLIAIIGCFEGLQVSGSAESVGRQTTRAVVESIFLVIVADAFFSIFFNLIGF